jgi:hypothetical protein
MLLIAIRTSFTVIIYQSHLLLDRLQVKYCSRPALSDFNGSKLQFENGYIFASHTLILYAENVSSTDAPWVSKWYIPLDHETSLHGAAMSPEIPHHQMWPWEGNGNASKMYHERSG